MITYKFFSKTELEYEKYKFETSFKKMFFPKKRSFSIIGITIFT